MRGCRCPGILAKLQAAFADRLLGWAKLGARRPHRVAVDAVCDRCGKAALDQPNPTVRLCREVERLIAELPEGLRP